MGYDFTRDVEGDRASVAAYWRSKKTKDRAESQKFAYRYIAINPRSIAWSSVTDAEARDAQEMPYLYLS